MKPPGLVIMRFCGVLFIISCFLQQTLAGVITGTSVKETQPGYLQSSTAKDTIKVDKATQTSETNKLYLGVGDTSQAGSYYDGDDQCKASNEGDGNCDERQTFSDRRWKEMERRITEMYEAMNRRDLYGGQLEETYGEAMDRIQYYPQENLLDKKLDYYDRRLKSDGNASPRSARSSDDEKPEVPVDVPPKSEGDVDPPTQVTDFGKPPPPTTPPTTPIPDHTPPPGGENPPGDDECKCMEPVGPCAGSINFNQWHPTFLKTTASFCVNNKK